MKKLIMPVLAGLLFVVNAFGHQASTRVSSEMKAVKETDLSSLEKGQTTGQRSKQMLSFTESDIKLVVLTGPEDDMLSYRIQGVRNPTLVVPSGATLPVLFVNVDEDMKHDLRFGHVPGDFMANPPTTETVGAEKLTPKTEEAISAQEIV